MAPTHAFLRLPIIPCTSRGTPCAETCYAAGGREKNDSRLAVPSPRSKAESPGARRLQCRTAPGTPANVGGGAMRTETQLSVFLENRAGVLADVAADLARHGISIRALTVANLVDHSLVRLV